MNVKSFSTLLIAIVAIISFSSCNKKTNTQGRYVPKEAVFVGHFNGESLNAKLPWEEIKNNQVFKMAYTDSSLDALTKKVLDNPENSGIDIKADLVFYVVKDSIGGYVGAQGKINDVAKFKEFYTASYKDAVASQKDGIDYLTKDRVSVSWDREKFIIVADLPEMNKLKELNESNPFDTAYTSTPVISTRNSIATAASLYTLTEDKSLAKESRFSKLVNDKADMHFWVNYEELFKDMPGMEQMAMMNLTKIYEDLRITTSVNFENGQIKADMAAYGNKELTEIYKKYSGKALDENMAARMPAGEMPIFFALNFKPEGIKEMVKLTGMDGLLNMAMAMIGFTIDDFVKANKGDVMFGMYDFKADSFGINKPKVIFAASIGDKAAFDKLIAAGVKAGKNEVPNSDQISYNKNEKYFVIGNDKTANDGFINGKGSKPAIWDKLKKGPFAGYINLQYLMNVYKQEASRDNIETEILNTSIKFWSDVVISGGQFKDGGLVQHVEVNLMDKNSNSLKQLNKYLSDMAVLAKKKKEANQLFSVDSTAILVDTTLKIK
ncbi:MAG TPA: DUF4836 family protein [Ferruginibacter sp.]|nr:DUF4836 family protein [Ferruginibacter sp.]HRE63074.1 DUF4836 family protein [Ferruginibacter sp.]